MSFQSLNQGWTYMSFQSSKGKGFSMYVHHRATTVHVCIATASALLILMAMNRGSSKAYYWPGLGLDYNFCTIFPPYFITQGALDWDSRILAESV